MKNFLKKHLSLNIVYTVAGMFPLLFATLCYYIYLKKFQEICDPLPFAGPARDVSSWLLFSLLIAYVLFLFVLMLTNVIRNYRTEQLSTALLTLQQHYDILFHSFTDTIWQYDILTDTLNQPANSDNAIFSPASLPGFRSYILTSGVLHPDDMENFLQFYDSMICCDDFPIETELRLLDPSGNYSWYRMTGKKVFSKNGNPISIIGHTVDISSQKQEEIEQQEIANQDALTRLYKYEGCAELITQYFEHLNHAAIAALFLINLDDFSRVSEQYGRVFSDAILLDFSVRLRKKFQPKDILGRIGTDTFLVLVTDLPSMPDVEICANDLCSMFHEIYSGIGSSITVRASVGVSVFPANANQFETLYHKAAQALHRAKQLGKDRYYIYDSLLENAPDHTPEYNDLYLSSSHAISYDESSLINTGMIINSIDILFNSRESDLSIQMLLSLLGSYYKLDRLCICQNNSSNQTVSITHEWTSNQSYQMKEQLQNIPITTCEPCSFHKQTKTGVFFADHWIPDTPDGLFAPLFHCTEPQSIFQCGIHERGADLGSITAVIYDPNHHWTKSDTDSLTLIAKLVGSYISRSRSLQHAAWVTRTDQLTNSYNFNTFITEVNKRHTAHPNRPLAMVYSDLHQFKLLNENYGFQTGDFVLQRLADLFREICPSSIICRISGDKFAMCIPDVDEADLEYIAKQLIIRTRQMRGENGEEFKLSLVVGLYQMKPTDNAIIALDRANIARKNAQHSTYTNYSFFNDDMQATLLLQKNLEDSMEDSLLRNAFLIYFQPKYNINDRTLCGAEALVRWQHPTLGFLTPNTFIPLFEANGFIRDLDYYMFEQVCIYLRDLLRRGKTPVPISVNFSREHFTTNGLLEKLKVAVEFYQIPPQLIEIEVTESAFAGVDHNLVSLLEQIRDYGFGLAMDDFGSGLSSLNLLSSMPITVLKIDKDFFQSRTTTERERIVISNIVRMASELEIEVICEGVETEEQLLFLRSIDCAMAQGYLFSKPLSLEEYDKKYYC